MTQGAPAPDPSITRQPVVLIYRLGSLGDTVVALPCFNRIRDRWPDARRIVLTNVPVAANAAPLQSILGDELVDGVLAYPVGVRSIRAIMGLIGSIRRLKPQVVVYLMPHRGWLAELRDRLFFRACGVRRLIGFPDGEDLRVNRIDPATGEAEPEAYRLARSLAPLGDIQLQDPRAWDLRLTPAERDRAQASLGPLDGRAFIAVHTGGKAEQKDWGQGNWAKLLARLSAGRETWGLACVGAAGDRERGDALLSAWPGPAVNLCGELTPRESAALLARAALFIGHDSGPLHLAAAGGAPSLGLFGDFNQPRVWHPIGRKVRVLHELRGIHAISVEQVVEATERLLASAGTGREVAA